MTIGQKSLGFFTQKRLCNRIEDICGQSLRDDHQSAHIKRRDFCFVVTCASRNFSATEEAVFQQRYIDGGTIDGQNLSVPPQDYPTNVLRWKARHGEKRIQYARDHFRRCNIWREITRLHARFLVDPGQLRLIRASIIVPDVRAPRELARPLKPWSALIPDFRRATSCMLSG